MTIDGGYTLTITRDPLVSWLSPVKYRWTVRSDDWSLNKSWYGTTRWGIRLRASRIVRRHKRNKSYRKDYVL